MRIFFDTNVLIAAYLWKGIARQVFEADILVTRDKDLLDISDAVDVPRIARPEDFRDVLPDAP